MQLAEDLEPCLGNVFGEPKKSSLRMLVDGCLAARGAALRLGAVGEGESEWPSSSTPRHGSNA